MKNVKVIIAVTITSVILAIMVVTNCVYGNAVAYEEKVTEAISNVQVAESRRESLYSTLVSAIKSYDKHEAEIFLKAVETHKAQDGSISDESSKELNKILNVIVEKYPDLKSQYNYKEFLLEAAVSENNIRDEKKAYNKAVSRYNTYVRNPIRSCFLSITSYEVVEFEKISYNVEENAAKDLFE